MEAGIYEIRNLVNQKRYVGSSKNVADRLDQHRRMLLGNRHHSSAMQNAWNKYGAESFSFNLLAVLEPRELLSTEQRLLDYVFTREPDTYNVARISKSPMAGRKHSEATKVLMSSTRQKENNAFFGKSHSQETKDRIANTKLGTPAWNKGIPISAEAKAKMVASKTGKPSTKVKFVLLLCRKGHRRTALTVYTARGKHECKVCQSEASARCISKRSNQL